MVLSMLAPAFFALLLTAAVMPLYISRLKRFQINQFLREDGPRSHAHKAKTPTMGGLVFIITTTLTVFGSQWWSMTDARSVPATHAPLFDETVTVLMIIGALCGLVGLVDDSAKVIQKANKGISGFIRLGIETAFGAGLGLYLLGHGRGMLVVPSAIASAIGSAIGFAIGPGAAAASTHPAWEALPAFTFVALPAVLFIGLAAFLAAATTNAINLHDGMDGLAAGTSCQVFATLAVLLYETGQPGYAIVAATAAGALLGFLLYNRNPAQIFMGDTGSLFIGGLMACLVTAGGLTLWFIPLALIYIVEALSVMIQVVTFKLTKPFTPPTPMSPLKLMIYKLTKKVPGEGRRVFRMAPLHHHYEAVYSEKGYKEWQVVFAFWVVQFLLCASVLAAFEACRAALPCARF